LTFAVELSAGYQANVKSTPLGALSANSDAQLRIKDLDSHTPRLQLRSAALPQNKKPGLSTGLFIKSSLE
jgi:hypothetical protein